MFEENVLCPECGYELTKKCLKDDTTAEITIEFFCDQAQVKMYSVFKF